MFFNALKIQLSTDENVLQSGDVGAVEQQGEKRVVSGDVHDVIACARARVVKRVPVSCYNTAQTQPRFNNKIKNM